MTNRKLDDALENIPFPRTPLRSHYDENKTVYKTVETVLLNLSRGMGVVTEPM